MDNEFSKPELVETTDWLISYHMRSFRARRIGLLENIEIWPGIVSELDNLRCQLGNEYTAEERSWRSIGLHEIVSRNRAELKEIKQQAQEATDAKPYLKRAEKLMEELDAAVYLLELLNG